MDLAQEIKTAQELVALLKTKKAGLDKREQELVAREKKVDMEEGLLADKIAAHKAWDTAEVMLQKAEAAQADARKALAQVEEAQARLSTLEATQLERINAAKHEAQLLVDQADQVRKDKIALEEDKKTYKAKVLKEIQDNLKMGKI